MFNLISNTILFLSSRYLISNQNFLYKLDKMTQHFIISFEILTQNEENILKITRQTNIVNFTLSPLNFCIGLEAE